MEVANWHNHDGGCVGEVTGTPQAQDADEESDTAHACEQHGEDNEVNDRARQPLDNFLHCGTLVACAAAPEIADGAHSHGAVEV
eukprot:CAMPEP_0114129940 /NCGR_PEP_ID=MMETSP0043_2-20121206/11742_1 /TAXON_ID=464988 /ORGANISM="Hemiselmis andersenii, Strain CCMP644" /LENGTH=83 /DNA_ID=CAMNT_0001223247 /DNA_START=417 /DNA_END=668 /DNA_ORIENTATION=+